MKIDPWSSTTYQDYKRLRDEFGIEEFTHENWGDLPHPHKLLRRGVVFGHRDFQRIQKSIKENKPWAILTGLMPSGDMHLGHKLVIDQVIYYQTLGAEIFIAVADIEAFATRGYTLKEAEKALILKTLEETGGNRSEAARRLQITRKTLLNKLKSYQKDGQ